MANGFSTFKQDHHYATGIILMAVGVTGAIGSFTGELANMLAALWVPDILFTSSGSQADTGTSPSVGAASGATIIGGAAKAVGPAGLLAGGASIIGEGIKKITGWIP